MGKKLYVIGASESGPLKIGITAMLIQHRINNLQPGYPGRLRSFGTWECSLPWDIERRVHRLLGRKWIFGEWFDVAVAEAVHAVEEALAQSPQDAARPAPGSREKAESVRDLWETDTGLSAPQIAARVGLSEKTLRTYLGPRGMSRNRFSMSP